MLDKSEGDHQQVSFFVFLGRGDQQVECACLSKMPKVLRHSQKWYKRTTLLHFHFGECLGVLFDWHPPRYIPPTQPSSSLKEEKTNKKKREKQKETLMAHHPSQFMILLLLLLLLLSLSLVSAAGMCTATIWHSFGYKRRRLDRIV